MLIITVLPVDGILKCKGPVSQFVVERASLIIHCRISQTLLWLYKTASTVRSFEKLEIF